MATVCVLFVGLTLNATLGAIAVSGFITSDEGESLSNVSVSSPTNQDVKSTKTDPTGFYSISGLNQHDVISYSCSGYDPETRTLSSSLTSQSIDVEMTSSSTN